MKRLFHKQSDQEIIQLIRDGNKNILLQLYKSHLPAARKFIEASGGQKDEAEELLQDALTQFWTEANQPQFELTFTLRDYLLNKVRSAWRNKHDASSIRTFMTNRLAKKGAGWKKWIVFGSSLLLLLIAAWWYLDSLPIGNLEEHLPLITTSVPDSTNNIASSVKSKARKRDTPTSEEVQDSTLAAATDSLATKESSPDSTSTMGEELVIRKDELLYTRIIQVVNKETEHNKDRSLAQETAARLNPEAGLPEEAENTNRSFAVEFWKSPVNYKGYKAGKTKLVFYGIDQPDWVRLLQLDGKIYLEYAQNYYLLDQNMDFQAFSPISDQALTGQLKR